MSEDIFDYKTLAGFLRVEEKTIRYLQNQKALPYFKVGREIRFRRSAIEQWAQAAEVYPANFEKTFRKGAV